MGSLPPPPQRVPVAEEALAIGEELGRRHALLGRLAAQKAAACYGLLGDFAQVPPPPSRQGVGHRRALPLQVRRWPGGKRPRPRKTIGGLADPGLRRGPADPIEGKGKPIAEVSSRVWVRPAKDESAEGRSFSPNTGPGGG